MNSMDQYFKKYLVFWISQSVSQLGSAMTGFALVLWVYSVKHSAMTVSIMLFCNYIPYIVVSLFSGSFVDRHSKKRIMLASDGVAAAASCMILVLWLLGILETWHIYMANAVIGAMNAFQAPASSVAIGKMVPEDKLANVSGMNSFSDNLVTVLAPVLAASLYAVSGLKIILLVDLGSFAVAFLVLLIWIAFPEEKTGEQKSRSVLSGCKTGYQFLNSHKEIFILILTMALMNFFSRLTYENILSPMILLRSGNDQFVLGIVNAVMGIGGILGGIIVSMGKLSGNPVKMIYISAGISFLLGDLCMGAGRNVVAWSVAGLAASAPIPFINAGQNVILYRKIPGEMQGRIFAVRNAIQYSTIPLGLLLGGFLADYVFEPFMQMDNRLAEVLHILVGEGAGSGMAAMFLCTGILGSLFSIFSFHSYRKKGMYNQQE